VRVKPPEIISKSSSEEVAKKPRMAKFNTSVPEPVFGAVLNDVRAQFDRALNKMYKLNQSSSDMINDAPMRMEELTPARSFSSRESFLNYFA